MTTKTIKPLLEQIYDAVRKLEAAFPGRKFTPDGHMVGSIGEVLAHEKYDIELLPTNTTDYDAKDKSGRLIQIRTTQGNTAPLKKEPNHLIVQKLNPDATVSEIFNGPGKFAWELTKNLKADKAGQYNISLGRYKMAQTNVSSSDMTKLK